MDLDILPGQEADVPAYIRVFRNAFADHPRIPMMWPLGYTADWYAFHEADIVQQIHNADNHFIKAIDTRSKQIVAGVEWTFALDTAETAKDVPIDPNQPPPPGWPDQGNWPMRMFFKMEWEKWRREHLAGKPYISLDILVVDPACQGRKAGSKLLAWGCEQADRHSAMMVLESTPAGLALYKRFGFREITVLKANMHDFGWKGYYDEEAAKRVWMLRDPQRV
ncbi:hypothetical protein LTR78_007119 [Recurvomyces mirabilis]|uniref:N-acetyltransferase domain-containing protein n=1 Tax=Recurvomyces mirabilis TaxID=574656 RepID=A0AAE1BYW8_9PEZI|nr:hypothetical protein LTR78_007119 [Recurvomyces mirabilis]KAK5150909.1 hypothetical protein LTS14_009712 [Recurvomyces mirabilis]